MDIHGIDTKIYLEQNPKVAAEIEMAIRTKAGLISKKIEDNPKVEKSILASEKPEIDKK